MDAEPFAQEDEEIAQPIVQWYPRVGALQTVSAEVVAAAGLVAGVIAAFTLMSIGRKLFGNGRVGDLEVDRLTVRKLRVLED